MSAAEAAAVRVAMTYFEKHQIPVVTPSEVKWNIIQTIKSGQLRGVITIIGDSGIGKSQIIEQCGREMGYRVIDIRTASFTLLSAGVPQRANPETGKFEIAVPSIMPGPDEKVIVFFDELNQGQPHALNMFFSLMEDRCLFGYKLPDTAIIIAAYNPASSNYNVSKIEGLAAFNRRMMKFYMVTDLSEWLKYAATPSFHQKLGKPCHKYVLGLVRAKRSLLYDEKGRDKGQQYPCPATWETVSQTMHQFDKEELDYTDRVIGMRVESRIAASIGSLAASEFMSYVRDTDSVIDPLEVLMKFTSDDELRAKVKKIMNSPEGKGSELIENVVGVLFDNEPPKSSKTYQSTIDMFCKNMAEFWCGSLSEDQQQAVYVRFREQLDKIPTQSASRREYLRTLTNKWNREYPDYKKMDDRLRVNRKEHDAENGLAPQT